MDVKAPDAYPWGIKGPLEPDQPISVLGRAERAVHAALESAPNLKRRVVRVYQAAFGLLPVVEHIPRELSLIPDCFIGFHDKCPWSECGGFLAVHRPPSRHAVPGKSHVGIGVLDLQSSARYRPLSRSRLWNWQQGSELQWLRGTGCVVFNEEREGRHSSVMVDINGRVVDRWDLPIAALDRNGVYALSINFRELARGAPGYGYHCGQGGERGKLLLVCLASGSSRMIFDIRSWAGISDHRNTPDEWFLSHPSFSPDGRRVLFYCRSRNRRGRLSTVVQSTRLDIGGTTRLDLDDCSHYCWIDDDTILAYARPPSGAWQYLTVRLRDVPEIESASWLGRPDGHPQVAEDGRSVVTDSYPDRQRVQRLFVGDMVTRRVTERAAFRIPAQFRDEYRCDFHPRWNRDGTQIAIDTAHTGVRSVAILPLEPSWR